MQSKISFCFIFAKILQSIKSVLSHVCCTHKVCLKSKFENFLCFFMDIWLFFKNILSKTLLTDLSVATVNPLRISHALNIISKLLLLNTCGFDRTQCTAPLSLLFRYLINWLYVVELCPNPVFFTEQLRTSKGLFLNHVMNLYPLRVLPIALIQGHFHRFLKLRLKP